MSLVPKTATIQVRVVPIVKRSSEEILWRIGLTMSQAIELFLRRMIIDERLPFDVVALEVVQIGESGGSGIEIDPASGGHRTTRNGGNAKARKKKERSNKEFKKFFGARTSSRIRAETASKKGVFYGFKANIPKYGSTPPYACCISSTNSPTDEVVTAIFKKYRQSLDQHPK